MRNRRGLRERGRSRTGWFHDETGLDNSTVLQPTAGSRVPYTLVNHARWDRLRDVLPALLLRRSFRSFVLRVFADNRVTPNPILYRLRKPARSHPDRALTGQAAREHRTKQEVARAAIVEEIE